MGILFVFTIITCFFLFIAFLKNYQSVGAPIPHWYMIVHSVEILFYVIYFATRHQIHFKRRVSLVLLFILHDVFLVALMLIISNLEEYLYISLTLFYYIFFMGVIIVKRTTYIEGEPRRSELPRKTFLEMPEVFNNNN